jgi:hypothetical protein
MKTTRNEEWQTPSPELEALAAYYIAIQNAQHYLEEAELCTFSAALENAGSDKRIFEMGQIALRMQRYHEYMDQSLKIASANNGYSLAYYKCYGGY